MFPMRGQCDWDPPAAVNPEYTPAANALPYLEKISAELEAPLMPLVFNWEHAGPWVQPDAFPPVGGEASMKELMAKAKEKGWHPGIYGDGLNWVTWQKNTNYDGMPYFRAHGGDAAVCSKLGWNPPGRQRRRVLAGKLYDLRWNHESPRDGGRDDPPDVGVWTVHGPAI